MTEQIEVTARGRDFVKAVKYLKKNGGTFDAASKTWVMPSGKIDADDCRVFGLRRVHVSSPADVTPHD